MLYFILGVACTAYLYVAFKAFQVFKIPTFQAITVNYFTCIIIGFIILVTGQEPVLPAIKKVSPEEYLFAGIIGTLFITTFNLMAQTAQKIHVTASSISSKLSMIVPALVNIVWLNPGKTDLTFNYISGLILAITAVTLSSLKKSNLQDQTPKDRWLLILPIAVFISTGAIDTLINAANQFFVPRARQDIFPLILFSFAFILGFIYLCYILLSKKETFSYKSIIGGVALGIPNYFSIFFLLRALDHFDNQGAVLFPAFNLLVIVVTFLAGLLIFKERYSKVNYYGIALAVISLLLLL